MDAGWVSNLFIWTMQFKQIMSMQQQSTPSVTILVLKKCLIVLSYRGSICSSGCNLCFLVALWLAIYSLFCNDQASMKRFYFSTKEN
jgi:hypothetical protein